MIKEKWPMNRVISVCSGQKLTLTKMLRVSEQPSSPFEASIIQQPPSHRIFLRMFTAPEDITFRSHLQFKIFDFT